MKTSAFLPSQLASLARLFERDEPKVVVVVGAGVSVGASSAPHASWLGLLKHGVQHLVATDVFTKNRGQALEASLDSAFSPFDLKGALQHAELVEQSLTTPSAAAFAEWLDAAFRDFTIQNGETLEGLRDLQQAGALLLTTNYDSLLSEATGLPPVTWEEHAELFEVVRRQRSGILHIHGHWQRPSSVILGRTSYNRIAQDQDFQDVLKSLWLERSWLYVGCGDGLDDPNLGRLLEWGKRWNKDAPPDYFLAKADKALALAERPGKPAHVVSVGYTDHSELPGVLSSLPPTARCWPFTPVDANFALFRNPAAPLSIPFPSRQEYLDGDVPALRADAETRRRLQEHGWAFVLDVASVGKTTLALRIATAPEQRDHPTFYLDLAAVDGHDANTEASAAMRRLSRPSSLLILDNVHHQPELARQLWDQWRDAPRGSKLLLVATRMQRAVITAPAQDLAFFEHHAANPAVELRPVPDDLGRILEHIYRRVGGRRVAPLPVPPASALRRWHRDYGTALGAFCLAALNRLAEFERGNWDLPIETASDWVREKWLKHLDTEHRENALCLAVFGAQELELQVQEEALPHPGKTDQLLRLGLVAKTQRGQFEQYRRFSLREPGWGALLLAAQVPAADEEKILFETAARHPTAAIALSARYRREKWFERLERLWTYLALSPGNLIKLLPERPLTLVPHLAQAATEGKQPALASRFWDTIEREPDKLAARAWETQLHFVASFLDTAKRHHRNVTPLWNAIEREPAQLAARAWETPLHFVAAFLNTARRHQRNATLLWDAIEREPDKLAARAWETPLGHVASFLDTAKRHQRNVTPLWAAIERQPDKFAARAWETPLGDVGSFLDTARRHQRNVTPLWAAIERQPDKLAARAWETALGDVGSFLDIAKRHQRDVTPLWDAIEREPDRVAASAWGTSLNDVASFLDTAKRHERDVTPLWDAIERQPDKLAARAWETPLGDVGSFLETAKRHQRHVTPLWEAIEREPDRLAGRAWETSLHDVASFLDTAKRHHRNVTPLWDAIEREPDKLAARAWETPLNNIASFLDTCKRHQRNTKALVENLERKPDELAAKGRQTETAQLAGFCHHAPDTLVRIAIRDFQTTDWDRIPDSSPLIGATWVAARCGDVGREDLKSAIISTLLRRANPRDFPAQGMALANVAWLLAHAPKDASTLVPAFLDALCTAKWLASQFTNVACGPLAAGLRLLGLHQPPGVYGRFWTASLGNRLRNELSRFTQVAESEQAEIIQLLGCATLCGWPAQRHWFNNVPLDKIGMLPVDTLPHRADASNVEHWQLQLWLGLRVVTEVTGKPLRIPSAVIGRTLELWRSNLAESSTNAQSAEHRVNQGMVTWLESCA